MTVEWGNPKKLMDLAVSPFPMEALTGPHREYIEDVCKSLDVDPGPVVLSQLAAIAALYQRQTSIAVRPGYVESPSIYAISLLLSGERKTPIESAISAPIKALQARAVLRQLERLDTWQAELDRLEGLKKQSSRRGTDDDVTDATDAATVEREIRRHKSLRPPTDKLIVTSDLTGEGLQAAAAANGGSALVLDSEGSKLVDFLEGRHSKGFAQGDLLLKGWSAQAVEKVRSSVAADHIPRLTLSMSILMQPDQIRRLSAVMKTLGLYARMLLAWPKSRVGWQAVRCPAPSERCTRWWAHTAESIWNAVDVSPEALDVDVEAQSSTPLRSIILSSAADDRMVEACAKAVALTREGGRLSGIAEWVSKLQSHAVRIACALHAVEWGSEFVDHEITSNTMERSLQIANWCAQNYLRVERYLLQNVDGDLAGETARVGEWLKRRQAPLLRKDKSYTFTLSDVQRAMRKTFPRAEDVRQPLLQLESLNWVRRTDDEKRWEIHPQLGDIAEV